MSVLKRDVSNRRAIARTTNTAKTLERWFSDLARLDELEATDSPQFQAINLGHASDTTLSRSSAGRLSVEGVLALLASDIGVTVQGYDADLATWAGITPSANAQTLLAQTFAQMRASLDLEVGTDVQAYDADLTTWAGLTPSANFQTLVPQTFAQMRDSLDVVPGTDVQAYSANLATLAALTAGIVAPQGRLTLSTGVPVTASDVTGATTVYYTPYVGSLLPLYDGTKYVLTEFTETSQATTDNTKSPAAVANNSNYDYFAWLDGSTVRVTRGPAWTSDTARGTGAGTTELELVKGLYLNKVAITNGPAANRGTWVGTARSNGSAQINDSLALRMVWNAYNRRPRAMRVIDTTDSWTYSTDTFRQMNNNSANQIAFVRGLNEDSVSCRAIIAASNSSAGPVANCGIGLDVTNASSATIAVPAQSWVANYYNVPNAQYDGFPGLGYHFLAPLEKTSAGTGTWYGDAGAAHGQSGISGRVYA